MFNVIIIDDEPVIRKGLKNIVNWDRMNCQVVGEAPDGQSGCELIRKFKPDIIITDIRMPEMDGLEMVEAIRDIVPQSKIIIVTGYRDFEYVHESLKLGAFDFILKPTRVEELNSIIRRAVAELKLSLQKKEEYYKYKELFKQSIPILREKFLYDLLNEITTDTEQIIQKKDLYEIPFSEFVLVLIDFASFNRKNGDKTFNSHLNRYGIVNTFKELWEDASHILEINLNDNIIAFMIKSNGQDITQIIIKCRELQQIINRCFGLEAAMAISTHANGMEELPAKYRQCQKAMEHKFYVGDNSIIYYEDLDQFVHFQEQQNFEKLQKKLIRDIQSGNRAGVDIDLQEISRALNKTGNSNEENSKLFFFQVFTSIKNMVNYFKNSNHNQINGLDIASLCSTIQKCEKSGNLEDILRQTSIDLTNRVHLYNSNSIKQSVKSAVRYIEENYNSPLTLSEVAENVFLSTYYLSRMFKKELGKSFVDYLNEYRIEQSKKLLRETHYKAYEIAELVGINDAHYFSRLFKKHEGITPTVYRDISSE